MKKKILYLTCSVIILNAFAQVKGNNEPSFPPAKINIPNQNTGLIFFTAKPIAEYVQLTWSMANEVDNNFFTLERSFDFENFESIRRVNGKIKGSATVSYEITDHAPFRGVSYYRLKMTDYDGKHTYSEISSVLFASPGHLTLSRNATSGNYILDFKTLKEKEDIYTIEINNALGESVYKETLPGFIGRYNNEIDLLKYGKTTYTISISTSTEQIVRRVVAY